jgi:hypothetical protein
MAMLIAAPLLGCAGSASKVEARSLPFLVETRYRPEDCRSAGSPRKLIESGRALDIDGDRQADLVRRGETMLVRSASYPALKAERPWVRVPATSDAFGDAGVRELVKSSVLGPDLAFLQADQRGAIPQVQSWVDAGDASPQRIVSGFAAPGAEPNTRVSWRLDRDGSLRSIQVVREDVRTSGGVASESYDLRPGALEVPAVPAPSDIVDAGDLPAIAFLKTGESWSGACRNDDDALSAKKLACYRATVGDASAEEWMSARAGRSWTDPKECT